MILFTAENKEGEHLVLLSSNNLVINEYIKRYSGEYSITTMKIPEDDTLYSYVDKKAE